MWLWIIIGIVVVAIAIWAVWPRRGGIQDGRVIGSRRSSHGKLEGVNPSNQRNFFPW